MASFPLNLLPPPFKPQFENVPLALDGWNFACPSLTHMAKYLCKKFSPYDLSISQGTSITDKQTTSDNCAISSTITEVWSAKNASN